MAHTFKKFFIFLSGSIVLLAGIALLFLPGPAMLVIPLGLAILATEFKWAKDALKKVGDQVKRFKKEKPAEKP